MSQDFKPIIDAAREALPPQLLHESAGLKTFAIRCGVEGTPLKIEVNTESGNLAPLRKLGRFTVFDVESLNKVLADNEDAGDATVYVNRRVDNPVIIAILNDNGPSGPGWQDFRVTLEFRPTPQWVKWTKINGQMLDQQEFAEFIEENLADIQEPDGATALEIVTYLDATKTTNFKSGTKLQNGIVQLVNLENIDATVGSGAIAIPAEFKLGLAPVQGRAAFVVPARFRYRIENGKLKLGIKLQRIEDLMAEIVSDVVSMIDTGTNVTIIEGVPPDPRRT